MSTVIDESFTQHCTVGDRVDYGYGDAQPATINDGAKYGYQSTDAVDLGYGTTDASPYGYGDENTGAEPPKRRERPRRRGSVTEYSLEPTQVVKKQEHNPVQPPYEIGLDSASNAADKYGYGDTSNDANKLVNGDTNAADKYGYGDATKDASKYGYGETKAATDKYGYGDTSNDANKYGYGDTNNLGSASTHSTGSCDSTGRRRRPRRRGSVTKYSKRPDGPRRRGSVTKYSVEVPQEVKKQEHDPVFPKEIRLDSANGYAEGMVLLSDELATPSPPGVGKGRKTLRKKKKAASANRYGSGDSSPEPANPHGYGDTTSNTNAADKNGNGDSNANDTSKYGYGDTNAADKYGYGDTSNDANKHGNGDTNAADKYGYGDTTKDVSKYGYGETKATTDKYGYGDTSNDANKYGYGDTNNLRSASAHSTASGDSTERRHRPRRRGSVTKYSLEAQEEVATEHQQQEMQPIVQQEEEFLPLKDAPNRAQDADNLSGDDMSCDDASCDAMTDNNGEENGDKKKKKKGGRFGRFRIGRNLSSMSRGSSSSK
jgi:hypothetical protein